VIRLACPTGCPVKIQIPFRLRAEPVRCRNCTAWFRAPLVIEDGTYVEGDLLAPPGEPLERLPTVRPFAWRRLAVVALLVAVVAMGVAALALRRDASTTWHPAKPRRGHASAGAPSD